MEVGKNIVEFKKSLPSEVCLVAVSKTKPNELILDAYQIGQRIFGENKVQDLVAKYESLPKDIEWHMIGHLQRNKVKYIAPFVVLIHGVDSAKLLAEINKQALKANRIQAVLLQIHIAQEESKFGLSFSEAEEILNDRKNGNYPNVKIEGLMGMATNSDDQNVVNKEFSNLHNFYKKNKDEFALSTLSMGMSGDYNVAIANGSNMIRIGSTLFGARNY